MCRLPAIAMMSVMLLSLAGCALSPAGNLSRCRTENQRLAKELDNERRMRQNREVENRDLTQRLADAEKDLARIQDSKLAGGSLTPAPARVFVPPPIEPAGPPRELDLAPPVSRSPRSGGGWRPTPSPRRP